MSWFTRALRIRLIVVAAFVSCVASPVHAQESALSITVTPSLFQLSIGPGESWSSSVKVVNNNQYDATYYAQVLDFEAAGEDGTAKYIPVIAETPSQPLSYSLASWMTVPQVPMTIKAGKSQEIPFTLRIPDNAEPGGHYAAILVGTKPQESLSSSGAKISSYVSSLLFVRIKGDIVENGRIREFTTTKKLYQEPSTDFVLRFENTGNTHVRPEGDIEIFNMWGKERGRIKINRDISFGNVLPESVRKFSFTWQGEASAFDIGPYSAVVTLAYGEDGRKHVTAKTYFWVIPTVPLVATLTAVASIVFLLAWFIRRYIRRALELERSRFGAPLQNEARESAIQTLLEPIREGVVDLRAMRAAKSAPVARAPGANPSELKEGGISRVEFFAKYRLFFGFVLLVIVSTAIAWWYFERALVQQRAFKIQAISSEIEASLK